MHLCTLCCPDGAAKVHMPVHRLSFRHHAAHSSLQSFLRLQHDCILMLLPRWRPASIRHGDLHSTLGGTVARGACHHPATHGPSPQVYVHSIHLQRFTFFLRHIAPKARSSKGYRAEQHWCRHPPRCSRSSGLVLLAEAFQFAGNMRLLHATLLLLAISQAAQAAPVRLGVYSYVLPNPRLYFNETTGAYEGAVAVCGCCRRRCRLAAAAAAALHWAGWSS